jgi:hypothetical protein
MRQRAADLAGSDQSNFPARHCRFRSYFVRPSRQPRVTMPRSAGRFAPCYPLIVWSDQAELLAQSNQNRAAASTALQIAS